MGRKKPEPQPKASIFSDKPDLDLKRAMWVTQDGGNASSIRGLSAVNRRVAWLSGANGLIQRTVDGGTTWKRCIIPGTEKLDFRDIEAFDERLAYVMSAGPGEASTIYKTIDGGKTWKRQFINPFPKGFFNAIAFWDEETGIALSDPVGGKPYLIRTTNGGKSWVRLPPETLPDMLKGEYGFAASGTNMVVYGDHHVWFGTGGSKARVFSSTDRGDTWHVAWSPMVHGAASSGIFSLAFFDEKHGVGVGGDYRKPEESPGNVMLTRDGGHSWNLIPARYSVPYRSCVRYVPGTNGSILIAVGRTGSSYSIDNGTTWNLLDVKGFYTLSFGDTADAGWAAGADGRVSRLTWQKPEFDEP